MNPSGLAAADRTPARTLELAQTAAYYGGYVVIGIFAASLGPTLPALAEQTASPLSVISFLFTTRSLGYLLGSVVLGRLYDRVPAHRLMAGMLALIVALMVATPVIPSLVILALVQLLWGAAISTLDVGVNTLLLWVHRGHSGPYMTAGHIFFGAGALFTPVVVGQIIALTGGSPGLTGRWHCRCCRWLPSCCGCPIRRAASTCTPRAAKRRDGFVRSSSS
jgi:MFS family permease